MSLRNEQCNKVCRILDDVLANRPTERDSLITAVRKAFGALETEPHWIPTNERLPEDGIYLVAVERRTGVPRIDMKPFAKDLNKVDEFDFPKHKCGWYEYDSEYGYWENTNVIAWMPLPKPYQEESES